MRTRGSIGWRWVHNLIMGCMKGCISSLCRPGIFVQGLGKDGLAVFGISCSATSMEIIEQVGVEGWQGGQQECFNPLRALGGRRRPSWSGVDVAGEGVFGVCFLAEEHCEALVIRLIANSHMKFMKRDRNRLSQERCCSVTAQEAREHPAGTDEYVSGENQRFSSPGHTLTDKPRRNPAVLVQTKTAGD